MRRRTESDKTGTTPGDKGRFEGYDVLAQQKYWDPVTRELVLGRTAPAPQLSFFTTSEEETVRALVDLVLAQREEPRVPVVEAMDQRLSAGETDGWRYEDLPEDGEAWRRSLGYLDEDAKDQFGQRFHECTIDQQGELVQGIQDQEQWHGWPSKHVWSLWTRYACAAFYSHPWAWNEIGFGGPAYPRGYKVLRPGWREPWEVAEQEPEDPVPWAERAEKSKKAHEVRTSSAP